MLRSIWLSHPQVPCWIDYNGVLAPTPGATAKHVRDVSKDVSEDSIVGIMHHHGNIVPETPAWVASWRELRGMCDKVITLTRSNSIRRYLSTRIAQREEASGQDANRNSAKPRETPPEPLDIAIDDFLRWRDLSSRATYCVQCLVRPYYSVTYDQLVTDWDATMLGICGYLELDWDGRTPLTYRQETRPLEAIIGNWDRLSQGDQTFLRQEDERGL